MMQLLCKGVRIDLYESTNLQFTKTNSLFAFDDMAAERTTQFKLPKTPTNDAVFDLARVPAYNGIGMRRKFECQLQCGAVARNGYLYVTGFDGKDYACVMVTGTLFGIKSFGNHEWGSLVFNEFVGSTRYDANDPSLPKIAIAKYYDDYEPEQPGQSYRDQMLPSIDIAYLLQQINAQGVLPMDGASDAGVRLIRKTRQTNLEDVVERLIMSSWNPVTISSLQQIVNGTSVNITWTNQPEPVTTETLGMFDYATTGFGKIRKITFPDDTPQNLCICVPGNVYTDAQYQHLGVAFVGSRRFLRPSTQGGAVRYEGAPLAGQTIEIPEGLQRFILMTGADLEYDANDAPILFDELRLINEPTYNLKVRLTGDLNDAWNAQLTDLDLGMLIKVYCALTGKMFGQSKDGSYHFVDAITGDVLYPDVMTFKEIKREFGKYAQRSYVEFNKDSNAQPGESTRVVYAIDNDNITAEATIQTLKVNEGGIYPESDDLLLVRGVQYNEEESRLELPADYVAKVGEYEYLQRAPLVKSTAIQGLCNESTQVKITCRMSLYEFAQVDSFTRLYVQGLLYTWTDASWQKDVATFTLAKMP